MAVQKTALHDLGNHALVEAGAVQVGRLFGLQQLGHQRGRGHHKTQTQTRGQHLGERAQVNASGRVACGERQGRRLVEPQVAIGVVFYQRQAKFCSCFGQRSTACLGHGAPGGVLKVGQHVKETSTFGFERQVGHIHTVIITLNAHHGGFHGREGLQCTQVGGGFHQNAAAFVDQHFGNQVQTLLGAGGDQHL